MICIDIVFEQPASYRKEILPLGNGQICVFPYGGIWTEEVILGSIVDKNIETTQLLKIQFNKTFSIFNYCRKLSIDQAIENISFETEECLHSREYFVSRELNTVFVKISATKRMQGVSINLSEIQKNTIHKTSNNVVNKLKIIILDTDGEVEYSGEHNNSIRIRQSLYITIGLSYGDNIIEKEKIYQNGYNEIRKLHNNRYHEIFKRIDLQLSDVCNTSKIIMNNNLSDHVNNNSLIGLFFQYCRYLLISFYFQKDKHKLGENADIQVSGIRDSEEFISCLEYMICMFVLNLEECIGNNYKRLMNSDIELVLVQAIQKNELEKICNKLEILFRYIENPQLLYKVFYPFVKQQVKVNMQRQIYDVSNTKFYKNLCEKLQLSCSLLVDIKQIKKDSRQKEEYKLQNEGESDSLLEQYVLERIMNHEIWNPFSRDESVPYKTAERIVRMVVADRNGELSLLPALPKQWKRGHLTGIRIDRDKVIDVYWDNRKVVDFTLNELT